MAPIFQFLSLLWPTCSGSAASFLLYTQWSFNTVFGAISLLNKVMFMATSWTLSLLLQSGRVLYRAGRRTRLCMESHMGVRALLLFSFGFVNNILMKKGWGMEAPWTGTQKACKFLNLKEDSLCLLWPIASHLYFMNQQDGVPQSHLSKVVSMSQWLLCFPSVNQTCWKSSFVYNMKASIKQTNKTKHKTESVVKKNPFVRSRKTIRNVPTWRQIT